MHKVVITKPYRFVPPHRGKFWWQLFRSILPSYLRRSAGLERVITRGTEKLRASFAAGHGIVLAPNHCRPPDPMVLGPLSYELHRPLYVVASWHLFMQHPL
ncbi:MAG TPA: hypothetical protein VM029_02980, partial [Opitutaceae bacterium]|nr:hypothetical protein [Opitutaceae bacterium]